MDTAVALMAQPEEVVVTGDDLACRPEKLIWNTGMSPPRYFDVKTQCFWELAAVPP